MNRSSPLRLMPQLSSLAQALSWFLLSILLSNLSDLSAKFLGDDLHPSQITFTRFFLSLLLLLPIWWKKEPQKFVASDLSIHFLRGALLFIGTAIWFYGLTQVPLASATAIGFSIPFFTIFLASFLLGERIRLTRSLTTIIGFIGVWIILNPSQADFKLSSLTIVIATFLYALLDVVNKKYVSTISELNMLFYSSATGTLFSLFSAFPHWSLPSFSQSLLLLFLGMTANLILWCMLRAFRLGNASFLSPFRYVELLFSISFGYLFFGEIPTGTTLTGAFLILSSMLALGYLESQQKVATYAPA